MQKIKKLLSTFLFVCASNVFAAAAEKNIFAAAAEASVQNFFALQGASTYLLKELELSDRFIHLSDLSRAIKQKLDQLKSAAPINTSSLANLLYAQHIFNNVVDTKDTWVIAQRSFISTAGNKLYTQLPVGYANENKDRLVFRDKDGTKKTTIIDWGTGELKPFIAIDHAQEFLRMEPKDKIAVTEFELHFSALLEKLNLDENANILEQTIKLKEIIAQISEESLAIKFIATAKVRQFAQQ